MYRRTLRHRCSFSILATALAFAALLVPASGARTEVMAQMAQARHLRVYGYLTDSRPATDGELLVYSKTHKTTYRVYMTSSTVVKVHTQTVSRASLHSGLYVIVTCDRGSNGSYVAVTVHIEYNHGHRRSTKKSSG